MNRTLLDLRCERAAPDTVEPLHAILRACSADLRDRRGLRFWDPPYPLERLRQDAAERAVYGVRLGGTIVATFTVGTVPPLPYDPAAWFEPAARALYVSRLAVLPKHQGQGIGSACLAAIERLARDASCAAVRCDAFAGDPLLLRFYERAGFIPRGTIELPEGAFTLLEKRLPGATAIIVGEEREGR